MSRIGINGALFGKSALESTALDIKAYLASEERMLALYQKIKYALLDHAADGNFELLKNMFTIAGLGRLAPDTPAARKGLLASFNDAYVKFLGEDAFVRPAPGTQKCTLKGLQTLKEVLGLDEKAKNALSGFSDQVAKTAKELADWADGRRSPGR